MDPVVVVGGGASGVLAVVALLRTTSHRVVLIDPAQTPGAGLAYRTVEPAHLLNSPAGEMSAYPDQPGHFLAWCRRRDPDVGPDDFPPRRLYGDYLRDVLAGAATEAGSRLVRCRDTAVRVLSAGGAVQLADGTLVPAAAVVLAIGQPAPAAVPGLDRSLRGDRRYVPDPWAPGALHPVPAEEPVLLLGTGLTAVDVTLSLTRSGRSAPVMALSRHGLLPRAHVLPARAPDSANDTGPLPPPASLAALIRRVRRSSVNGTRWQPVVDALRPRVDELWQALPPSGQDRFLRHGRRFWEVHRHRMAPQAAQRVDALRHTGALVVGTGSVLAVVRAGLRGLLVAIGRPAGEVTVARVGAVVNCTGRGPLPRSPDPLVWSLLVDRLARPGPHGLGLDVDDQGALVGADGLVHRPLWTLGPPRLGRLWETTAVPEIREQAWRLAGRLARPAALSGGARRPAPW